MMERRTVLIAGGSSASGTAVARALATAGHLVLSVGSDGARISAAVEGITGAVPLVCDLTDAESVSQLTDRVHAEYGRVDALVHLVGGWRGSTSLAGQSDADWNFLHTSVLTTLRNTTRALMPDLAASPHGRLAIVSSTAVTSPTGKNAAYAAVKAAAETWTLAAAEEFRSTAPGSAAVVLVIKALVDDAMRAAAPERKFPGFTDVADLGRTVTDLLDADAETINGTRLLLTS